ncbi:AzlD domain-containing protein [Pseudomonas veronii]|jgi:branched-subunit amino acid transport protein|uniref:AzlD domain-containing protein n=1 Tax=Pseudomonas veronii TaxID=76761 RepID=UPI0006253F05|nr:AzlD domain-containing protein [Pseudomonas veronii]
MPSIDLIVVFCGVGTFLLRWLPLWGARRKKSDLDPATSKTHRLLLGVGPAAIAALLVVSLWGVVSPNVEADRIVAAILALVAIVFTRRLFDRGFAIPTLIGAAVYGALMQCMGSWVQ